MGNFYVSDAVKEAFKKREEQALQMIKNSGIEYNSIGIFGSYARGEYKATSDIDILCITDVVPERTIRGDLYCRLDMLHVDLVFVRQSYFDDNVSIFARSIRRDFVRRL